MKTDALIQKMQELGLSDYFEKMQQFSKNTIRLYPKKANEQDMVLGETKIGGCPDLPQEYSWPIETYNIVKRNLFFKSKHLSITKPLSFIAQLNLKEISKYDVANILPKSGMLYFFYTAEKDAWGFDYSHKNRFKIIYWDGDYTQLRRLELPIDFLKYGSYFPTKVEISEELSFPPPEHDIYNSFGEIENDKFWDAIIENQVNKIFGYADIIQNEMELMCEMVTNGINCEDANWAKNPIVATLNSNAKDWLLLLQIGSNKENGMNWIDSGTLYFWIKKSDLINLNFDKVWVMLQTY